MVDLNQNLNSSSSLSLSDQSSSQWLLGLFVVASRSNDFKAISYLNYLSWLEVYFSRASCMLLVRNPQVVGD